MNDGVTFSFMDTSSTENEFDLFVGAPGSSESSKTFIVGINYPSFSCGRISQQINLKDSIRKNDVGLLYEYGMV